MNRRPRLLDLYCCQGGASMGYRHAGFDVMGVDIAPQPRYLFPFFQGDVLEVLKALLAGESLHFAGGIGAYALGDFDALHASPPCQRRTKAQKIQKREHPALIAPTRFFLEMTGLPYVIENVVPDESSRDDPLIDPVMLCGAMFRLETYRHRLFESNFPLTVPEHPEHVARTAKMGRPPQPGEFMHVVGNFSGVEHGREVMGMPWASRDGLREAIPPVYTEWVGAQLMAELAVAA